jgi:hypothetical protein
VREGLIECVARVVLDAKGVSLSGAADFDEAVIAAHVALERQPGRDVSMSPDIRAIASSAKKMVVSVRSVRTTMAQATVEPGCDRSRRR